MVVMSNGKRTPQTTWKDFRYAVNLSARYFFNDWQPCEIIDVSILGASIRTKQILMGRDVVVLQITQGDRTVSVKTMVLHQSGMKVYLAFEDQDVDDIVFFLELINKSLYEKARERAKEFFFK